jgi:hypothetical protein
MVRVGPSDVVAVDPMTVMHRDDMRTVLLGAGQSSGTGRGQLAPGVRTTGGAAAAPGGPAQMAQPHAVRRLIAAPAAIRAIGIQPRAISGLIAAPATIRAIGIQVHLVTVVA